MIEKLMKVVKRENKKRSINITIGAVVGFLLLCTAVMGEDNYLWIKEDGETIKFNTVVTSNSDGTDGNWDKEHPYSDENIWDADTKTYINNIMLSSSKDNGKFFTSDVSYGFRFNGNLNGFINNGSIRAIGTFSYGLWNEGGNIGILTNNGLITGKIVDMGAGIYNYGGSIGILTNSGLIVELNGPYASNDVYGIGNTGSIETLINSGLIIGVENRGISYGIYNYGGSIVTLINSGLVTAYDGEGIYTSGSIGTIINRGLIRGIGNNTGIGISLYSANNNIENNGVIYGVTTIKEKTYGILLHSANNNNIENNGVIFGTTTAIENDGGTIPSGGYNYGILTNGTDGKSVVDDTLTVVASKTTPNANEISNYGLMFTVDGDKYTIKPEYHNTSGETTNVTINGIEGYIISNVKLNGTDNITQNNIILNANDVKDKYIYNGMTNAVTINGTGVEVKNSVLNSYENTVKFGAAGGEAVLAGSIVNEGIKKDTFAVEGSDSADTLILKSSKDESITGGNTVINGSINMGSGDDTLVIETGSIINGVLDGGTDNDTINFNSVVTRATVNEEINILHNISGFENMNINTNVTLFEKIVDDSGALKDLEITGVKDITIGAGGVLTLRINSAENNKHALQGNNGKISSTGGKLLLALNGAGNEEIISFGNLALDGSLATGSKGNFDTTSKFHTIESLDGINEVKVVVRWNIPEIFKYKQLNKIYHGILSVDELENFNVDNDEKLSIFLGYLNDIYAGNPYSYSSELSRKSMGMFREIVTENQFKANTGKWMIYGGLTHIDGGTKDTYYGKGYYTYDIGSSDMDADTKITGAYMLGEYGVSDTFTSGVVIGGNKLKSDLSNGSKLDGDALYVGGYVKKYVGNLKVTAGAGFQYGDYDSDRLAVNKAASDIAEPVMKYSDNYNDMTYDIYLNGRYSHNIGDNLFLEPYGTLSYTYIDQDGADEGSKALAIETDSKSFDYTSAKVGVDLKKVIPHEKGKSTLSAGVSYVKLLNGADEENITGRFKGGSDFDILVAHKNEHSLGLNAKYALELENGILFDVKGTYAVERDSHNGAGKNKTKDEWIVGAGLGYKF